MLNLQKYNLAVPRYTSYPTVPFWDNESFNKKDYFRSVSLAYWESVKEISLYIHLPFCESLCTYCACNTRITKNHSVEEKYIEYLIKEWTLYLEELPDKPVIKEIHLGGGTPTFFSPANLQYLLNELIEQAKLAEDHVMSFEGHPANTTEEHLRGLYELGFNRLSLGIQDFDTKVQHLISRKQTFEQVKAITELARAIGYNSINYDMVYGLPGQSRESLARTMDLVSLLNPDRIAYYSYAHVPTIKPAQRCYESHLPSTEEKYFMRHYGKKRLLDQGYVEVGLDHFVLCVDELLEAKKNKYLHRNFMGYTSFTSKLLIGLGVSAISDSWSGFAQNEKSIENYYARLDEDALPIIKGHLSSAKDLFIRKQILNLMCEFETSWSDTDLMSYGINFNFNLLEELQMDGLISFDGHGIKVLESGKETLRVICSALDDDLNTTQKSRTYSHSI